MIELPRRRAFLLELSAFDDGSLAQPTGRIEHLQSGETVWFHSRDELFAFVAHILRSEKAHPGRGLPRQ